MDIDTLEKRWIRLYSSSSDTSSVKNMFDDIVSRYSEKHRYYHTLEHISACLKLFDKVKESISEPLNIEIAIWFHDVIYNPKRSDNEEKSAQFAKASLEKISFNPARIRKIEHFILLTKHPSHPETLDEKHLLDIDLSILGANRALYDKYESWIRKEYKIVPNFLFKRGRTKVLNSFINLDSIFQTEYFHDKYESQARLNINQALDRL